MGRISFSLPDDLEKRVNIYVESSKEVDGISDFYQRLTQEFFKPEGRKTLAMYFLCLIGYPMTILTVLLRALMQTGDILYGYISAGILGGLLAGTYLLWTSRRSKKK